MTTENSDPQDELGRDLNEAIPAPGEGYWGNIDAMLQGVADESSDGPYSRDTDVEVVRLTDMNNERTSRNSQLLGLAAAFVLVIGVGAALWATGAGRQNSTVQTPGPEPTTSVDGPAPTKVPEVVAATAADNSFYVNGQYLGSLFDGRWTAKDPNAVIGNDLYFDGYSEEVARRLDEADCSVRVQADSSVLASGGWVEIDGERGSFGLAMSVDDWDESRRDPYSVDGYDQTAFAAEDEEAIRSELDRLGLPDVPIEKFERTVGDLDGDGQYERLVTAWKRDAKGSGVKVGSYAIFLVWYQGEYVSVWSNAVTEGGDDEYVVDDDFIAGRVFYVRDLNGDGSAEILVERGQGQELQYGLYDLKFGLEQPVLLSGCVLP